MPGPRSTAASLIDLLKLETPPVAMALVDEPPAGVPVFQASVPSACTMWRGPGAGGSLAPSPGGRPPWRATPGALEALAPPLSLGCLGMRTFTEVAGDRLMAVVPGAVLDDFMDGLGAAVGANRVMGKRYQAQKAAIPPPSG